LRRPATVGPTRGLRRRLPLRPRLPIGLRLASIASLPALPSNSTSDSHRRQIHGQPSCRSPACAFDRPSGPAFLSTCGLRRRPTLRPRLLTGLRLAPPADPSAMPSDEPPACAFDPSSSSTFQPASSFRLRPTFRSCLRTQPPTLIGRCIRGLRLVPTGGLRLQSTFGCAFGPATDRRRVPTFQLRLPDGLRLAPTANLPALPSKQLPTHANRFALGAAVRSTVDLRHRSTVRPCL